MTARIRLADVAAQAGVSRVAAGRVLLGSGAAHVRVGEASAKRIRQVARELGYEPNRSAQRLSGRGGNLIGTIIDTNAPEIERCRLVALERFAWKRGYQLAISALPPEKDLAIVAWLASALVAQGAAGIVFLTAGLDVAGLIMAGHIPTHAVFCGIPPVMETASGVVLDLAHGYRQAIRRFAATGRKRISIMGIDWGTFTEHYTTHRLKTVRAEAQRQGVAIVAHPVAIDAQHRTLSREKAEALVDTLLADGIDAVLAYSDLAALRLMQVLHKRGLHVPDDLAICGLNNLEVAALASPPLTTIDERAPDVAAAMLDLIVARIKGDAPSHLQRVIQPELIIRESA